MSKVETMTIKQFMSRDFKEENRQKRNRLIKHSIHVGAYALLFIGIPDLTFAASGIDAAASSIYTKLLLVGKWIIIIKGAIDTINNTVQGDFGSAKKSFLSYLMIYMILNALPWAMNEVDNVFKGI